MKTMKHTIAKYFAVAAALCLTAVGCSTLPEDNGTTESRDIRFSASIGSFQVKATDTAFENGDAMGVYAADPVNAENVRLTWQDGALTPSYVNINNSNPSTVSLGMTNRQTSVVNKEKSIFGQSESKKNSKTGGEMDDADKLRNYFNKNENMIKQKLDMEEKKFRQKTLSYNSMMSFKNPIQEILRNKIKMYEDKQVSQITDKVSNQEIFFNKSKDSKDATFTRSQISELKNKSLFTKLNNFDKKEVIKSFLEDEETKKIIYSYLYD